MYGRVSRRCRASSSRSWGTGRHSDSGVTTGQDTADWIGSSLASTLYPRIRVFSCSRLGMTPGSRPCPRYCVTSKRLIDRCISEAVQDARIWNNPMFTTWAAYKRLRDQENPDDPLILQRCRVVWKCRLPLKIEVFAWLLLRRRLMTRSKLQRMIPDAPAECLLCARAVEDC